MEIIADLHIHSRYSMATSKLGTPEYLDLWARKKGISLVGTGDFTHPAWREELKEKLVPAESGLYRLRDEYVLEEARSVLSIRRMESAARCIMYFFYPALKKQIK